MKTNQLALQSHGSISHAPTDPHQLAARFRKLLFNDPHGHPALRFWRDEFWRYRDGRYRQISDAELKAKITSFIKDEFRRTKAANRGGEILQVNTGLVANVKLALMGDLLVESHLDQPIWLGSGGDSGPYFSFTNGRVGIEGLVNGDRRDIMPHCSYWFSQTAFPYDYDTAAMCPRWVAFLKEVLEDDDERIALIQQWFGYCLTPDTSQQRFVVIVGEGANGKSVMLDVLAALLGPDNVSHVRVELFAQRFQLTMTLGKLANISYDTGEIDESAEATIKEFTGGDRMYFDRKGVPGVTASPTARLILATNHDPRFADRSIGIWRRMIVIPFRVTIEQDRQDPDLASKLKAELPGIFNWAVEGLRELRRRHQFVVPSICHEAWEEFKRESNPAREFLMDSYISGSGSCGCTDIYDEYRAWSKERGFTSLDAMNFGKELSKVFPNVERKRDSAGERRYRYHGLRPIGVDLTLDPLREAPMDNANAS